MIATDITTSRLSDDSRLDTYHNRLRYHETSSYPPFHVGASTSSEWPTSTETCSSFASSEEDSSEEVQPDPPKKKNPYSIDELLKKTPDTKRPKIPSGIQTLFFAYPPCGLLVDRGCTCNLLPVGFDQRSSLSSSMSQ